LQKGNYALVTLHRPSNVDDSKILEGILSALGEISKTMPVIFPVHPRTRVHLDGMHGSHADDRLKLLEPQSYLEFLNLMMNAGVVLTDSGGIQEETTVLGVPCLTLRNNTERPITITEGTNQLVGSQKVDIIRGFEKTVKKAIPPKRPKLWDGKTGQRIVEILREKVI
jgi:UDP-N-acetylglucosamine 2-epimerase (non-hydrolysing)